MILPISKYSHIFVLFFYLCSNPFKSFHGAISPSLIKIQLTYSPKIVWSKYQKQIYILKYIYSPTLRPKGKQKLPNFTFIPPTVCMMYPTRIYIKLTYIPQIVGSIYSIQIYISTKLYSPTLQLQLVLAWYIKYQNIYSTDIFSPSCWLHISNKKFSLLKKLKAYKKAFCGQETEPSNICMWPFLFNFNVKCMIYVVQFPSTYQTFATSTPPLLKM